MKHLIKNILIWAIGLAPILGFSMLFTGCSTLSGVNEEKAHQASDWIKERSGFIENAVAAITHVAVYASDADTAERERTIEIMHAVAGNLNTLIANGQTDPQSIQDALRINEPYFGPIFASIGLLIHTEMQTFSDNGYADLTSNILLAVTKGVRDGTTE